MVRFHSGILISHVHIPWPLAPDIQLFKCFEFPTQVKWAEQSYHEVFAKDDIIYLSAESDNVLESLEEGKAYVIGGLVDHNREKVPGDCDLCVLN